MSTTRPPITPSALGRPGFRTTDSLRRLYFAFGYNTTFLVNVMLTLGVISPYVLIQATRHDLSFEQFMAAIAITLLSAYCYNLVYIVNDYIDHDKDILLGTRKLTGIHVLGKHALAIVIGCFTLIITVSSCIAPKLILPLIIFSLLLMSLSVLHSKFIGIKLFTIFIERLIKFCAPLWLIFIITRTDDVRMMFAGALLAYPFGYTIDYAYRGYIRDRLKANQSIRYAIYAIYFAVLIMILIFDRIQQQVPLDLHSILTFAGIYAASSLMASAIAPYLRLHILDTSYSPHVAEEKRRLLAYGLVQAILLSAGGIYAIHG